MSATGGSIETVNIWGRDFAATGEADVNRKLGGFEAAYEPNGNATARKIKARAVWVLSGVGVEIDDTNGDHEYLQAIADSNANGPITITYPSGEVYQGVGSVTGELQMAAMSTSATLELSGPGKLTKQ